MSFDWTHLLIVARQLANDANLLAEAKCRSAINRAYYSAFGSTRYFLILKGNNSLQGEQPGIHDEVIKACEKLGQIDNCNVYSIGNKLKQLLRSRKNADYEIDFEGKDFKEMQEVANKAIDRAQYILNELGRV